MSDPAQGPTRRQIRLVVIGLVTAMLLASMDQTVVSTALPTIASDLDETSLLSWVITAYLLTITASTPLWGKAGDLIGRKRAFQLAIVIFLVGSALCGAAQTMPELIGARAVQGVGAGGIISVVFAILGDLVSPRERGRYQGYFGAEFAFASIVGPLVGGFAVDHATWRLVFYINLPLGAAALVLLERVLPRSRPSRRGTVDWLGASLLVISVGAVMLAAQLGGTGHAWTSGPVVGLFAAFVTFAVLFVMRERAAADPVLSMSLFGSSVFCAVNVVSFVSGVALFAVLTFVPQYLQVVQEVTATRSGLLLLPFLVGVVTCSVGSGILISRTGAYRLYPVFGTALMTAGVVLLSQLGAETSQLRFGVGVLVFGAGLGLFIQILILVVQNVLPSSLGVATSAVTFFRTLGGAVGASALGALHASALTDRARRVPPDALDPIGGQAGLALGPRELTEAGRRAPALHEAVASIYAHAAGRVFLWVIPFGVVSVVAAAIAARDSRALRTDLYYEPIETVI